MEEKEDVGKRRILGEVQLGIDVSESTHWSSPNKKRLSEVIGDQRNLKEQYNATAQQLHKRDEKIEDMAKKIQEKNEKIEKLVKEKGKLLGQIKKFSMEKEEFAKLLEEEMDVRKMIQLDSQKLVTDIKTSYENKISKMKDELKTKQEFVDIKQGLVTDLECLVKQLRAEILELNAELKKLRNQEREAQGRMSQSVRGSISMLQSQLNTKSQDLEEKINALELKHKEECREKTSRFQKLEKELRLMLDEKVQELQEVRGRLEESRQAREKTLADMHKAQAAYSGKVRALEKDLENALEELIQLQNKSEHSEDLSTQVQGLELQLQCATKEHDDIVERLAMTQDENEKYYSQIQELESLVEKLEQKLLQVEQEKQELYEKTQECLQKSRDVEVTDSSALKLVLEQLEQTQSKMDEVREHLIAEKQRSQKLTENFAEIEKEYGLAKVDIRVLNRDKVSLEARIVRKNERIDVLSKQLEEVQISSAEMTNKMAELQQSLAESTAKASEVQFQLENASRKLEEAVEEKIRLEAVVKQLENDCATLEREVNLSKEFKEKLQEHKSLLIEKEDEIAEKTRKIDSLKANVTVLKEATSVLDQQLCDFEAAFTQKLNELEKSEEEREKLTVECSLLKENLQKAKIDLNEANSLKAFAERRLGEVDFNLKRNEAEALESIAALKTKLEEYRSSNSELQTRCTNLAAEMEKISAEKEHCESRLDEVKSDNLAITQELHKCVDTIFELKHETITLKNEIAEAESKAKTQIKDLEKLYATAVEAKESSNLQMQCTIDQQKKLIKFLQDQNEALSKKKKTFAFFSRDKEESTPAPSSKKGITLLRNPVTPTPATPTSCRIDGILKQKALTLAKCSQEELLEELEQLTKLKQTSEETNPNHPNIIAEVSNKNCSKLNVGKCLIMADDKQQIDPNCIFHIVDDLYLLGCDQGLFSRKQVDGLSSIVKIGGVRSVSQMDFVSSLNSVLFIEGPEQRLVLASMGIVRMCAEAADCSKPHMELNVVADLQNCHMFQVRDIDLGDLTVCVTTEKHIHILSWKDSSFVLRQKISTPEVVTCMTMTPCSVIYGSGKVYELDTKNYQLEEFLDETDPSLYFVIFGSDDDSIPMAIIDVGMSNWTPGRKSYTQEFLICFPTMGVFVDKDGQRTRGEDIAWQKFPQSINYRHPNLYIFHHSSVEVIKLDAESYTTKRVEMSKDAIGKEISIIPPSSFIQLQCPRYLGKGARSSSIVVCSRDKHNTEVYDIYLENQTTVIKSEPVVKEDSSSFSIDYASDSD